MKYTSDFFQTKSKIPDRIVNLAKDAVRSVDVLVKHRGAKVWL